SLTHVQTAYFDQPDRLDKYSDETFGWDSDEKALHGWTGTGLGLFYKDGDDFCNLCGAPGADGNPADVVLTAEWVLSGQIIVTVTKDGVRQEGLTDHFELVQGSTSFNIPLQYENGRYVYDPEKISSTGGMAAQLPPGEYEIRFKAPGYPAASARIDYGQENAIGVVFKYYTVSLRNDPVYPDFSEIEISGGEPVEGTANTVVALDGDTLHIKTTVGEGYRFAGYTSVGAAPVWEEGDPSKADQAIEVRGRADITAHIEPVRYSVTVVNGTADKAAAMSGETVRITADDPESGNAFVQWAHADGVSFGNASAASTTFTMPAKDVTVTAVCAPVVIGKIKDKEYNGLPQEPADEVSVSLEGVDLMLTSDDYEVTFKDNVDAGDAKVIVTMKAPRAGRAESTFRITPRPATITVDSANKAAGEDDPVFTGMVNGILAGDDLGEVRFVRLGEEEAPGTYEGVLTAEYTPNKNYDVTVRNGDFTIRPVSTLRWLDGDGSVLQDKTFEEGEPAPVYDGREPAKAETAQYTYEFSGWDEGTVEGSVTTYRPQFREILKRYKVTFVDYDGKTVLKEAVFYDYGTAAADIAVPEEPARKADAQYTYAFSGWTPEITEVTADAVYTAVYESGRQKYTITWLQDDGTQIDRTTVEYGEIPVHADPVKAADTQYTYSFAGWSPEIQKVSGDAAYKAVYTAAPVPVPKGILTFDLCGGTLDGRTGRIIIEANVGDTVRLPGAPARKGYTFRYWKGSRYEAGAEYKVEGDHTFTAEWEENETAADEWEETETAAYTVIFDVNGHGKAPASQTIEEGGKASRPKDPTEKGYTFGGWFTDQECTTAFDFNTAITQDITLYAKWTKDSSSSEDTKETSPRGTDTSATGAKTGDDSNIGLLLLLFAASALSLLLIVLARRRNR
ncbi:MAG: InlB B-repeat-containing protein, partial [Mogibacterium sp.]|nr:InlB B-repeat-containing protein [Mogibacterium sp.]